MSGQKLSPPEMRVLSKYPRAVFHMRSQAQKRKLVPMFGAGIGRDFGLPNWDKLVERISAHADVSGACLDVMNSANTSRTQLLYQHFRNNLGGASDADAHMTGPLAARERRIRTRWFSIIHECLYRDAKDVDAHPYLRDFVPLISAAPLTINYNFDDYIEALLERYQDRAANPDRRGYETVWEPNVQYRYDSGVIYHPNGYLPRSLQRGASSWLVFGEDTFADQLIDSQHGHYSTLLSHLVRYTGLLLGLSLEDPTLKHLLRQSGRANPGHVHYYVSFSSNSSRELSARERVAAEANFDLYNLVTLHLDAEEIGALARLVVADAASIAVAIDELGLPESYVYFLSGAVGGGKTSALAYFKNLTTFDEWIDQKPALLLKAADSLSDEDKVEVDHWIDGQFRMKNLLTRRAEHQVVLVDRSPIDPIAFSKGADRRARAEQLVETYKPRGVADGMVLLMCGSPQVMDIRTHQRHKQGSVEYIERLQQSFKELWGAFDEPFPAGVALVDTVDRTVHDVVREISRVVHLSDYQTADVSAVLSRWASHE